MREGGRKEVRERKREGREGKEREEGGRLTSRNIQVHRQRASAGICIFKALRGWF